MNPSRSCVTFSFLFSIFTVPYGLLASVTNDGNQTDQPSVHCTIAGRASSGSGGTGSAGNRVYLYRGSAIEAVTDVSLPGLTFGYSHTRTYNSELAGVGGSLPSTNGEKWLGGMNEFRLVQSGDDIVLYVDASTKRTFQGEYGSYTAPDDLSATLVKSGSGYSEIYTLTFIDTGDIFVFIGFDSSRYDSEKGRLKERTNWHFQEESESGVTYSIDVYENDQLSSVTTPQGWTVSYTYLTSGYEDGKLDKIEVKNGSATVIRRVEYTYYGEVSSPSENIGNVGDLVQVKYSDADSAGNLTIVKYRQYRYYDDTDTNGNDTDGNDHQLKLVLEPDAIERIIADTFTGITSASDILTKGDSYSTGGSAAIEEFATRSYTYYSSNVSTSSIDTPWEQYEGLETAYGGSSFDETDFVKTVTLNGGCGGCGGGGGGGITRTYFYMQLTGQTSNLLEVTRIVVEDTEDAADPKVEHHRVVYGLNKNGTILRRAFIEDPTAETPQVIWCTSVVLGDSGNSTNRVEKLRSPSTHLVVNSDSNVKKFLDPENGTNDDYVTNYSVGLIQSFVYNAEGRRVDSKVKKGRSSTEHFVGAVEFGDGTTNKPKHLPVAIWTFPSQGTTKSDDYKTTISYTFWNVADTQIKVRTTSFPAVETQYNGSNSAIAAKEYFDELARLRWSKDGEGNISYHSFHPNTGGLAYSVRDVDTDDLSATDIENGSSGNWISWGSSTAPESDGFQNRDNGNLEVEAENYFDDLGRPRKTVEPYDADGTAKEYIHYTAYDADSSGRLVTSQFRYWSTSTKKPLLPISTTKYDAAGRVLESFTVDPARTDAPSTDPLGLSTGTTSSHYYSWSKKSYDALEGDLDSSDRYIRISNGEYLRDAYKYDPMGRRYYTKSADGTIRYTIFDLKGRGIEHWMGTDDTGATYSDPDGSGTNNMVKVSETFYDGADATTRLKVGDGNVTTTIQHLSSTATQTTENEYDFRSQLERTRGENQLATDFTRDWMGRVTKREVYADSDEDFTIDSTPDYELRQMSETKFDVLGKVYREIRYKVTSNSPTVKLTTDHWFDSNGRQIKTLSPNNLISKTSYDGVGRASASYVSFDDSAGEDNYSAASTLTSDTVATQREIKYDGRGRQYLIRSFEREHDASGTGALTTTTARVTYSALWYDQAERVVARVNYGTNGGTDIADYNSDFDPEETAGDPQQYYSGAGVSTPLAPNSSDKYIVVKTEYSKGEAYRTTDNRGKITHRAYNDLGQVTVSIENFANGATGPGEYSTDRITGYYYSDERGLLTRISAKNPKSASVEIQDTYYIYDSDLNRSWLTKEVHADSETVIGDDPDHYNYTITSGSDHVSRVYNYKGQVTKITDQIGAVRDLTYDDWDQVSVDKFSNSGTITSVDSTVIRHEYTRDDQGRLTNAAGYDAATGGYKVSEVEQTYTAGSWGQVTASEQAHDGAADGSTPKVQYTFEDGEASNEAKYLRLDYVEYPGGFGGGANRKIYLNYESSGLDGALSLLSNMANDGSGTTKYADYDYIGAGRVFKTTRPECGLELDFDLGGGSDYDGWDRFGRIVEQKWAPSSGTEYDHTKYGYDRSSNRLYKENLTDSGGTESEVHSELYHQDGITDVNDGYDGLSRLGEFHRGEMDTDKKSLKAATETYSQDFTLDVRGNWITFDDDGAERDRTHNKANKISTIETPSIDPVYDAAGNMTEGPLPSAEGTKRVYIYDAWNRLVEVTDGAADPNTTVYAEYRYDALGRRIRKFAKNGSNRDIYEYYYSEGWQVLEVRLLKEVTGAGEPSASDRIQKQYLWDMRYIDAPVVRWCNLNGEFRTGQSESGTDTDVADDNEAAYYTTDANWNVTAALGEAVSAGTWSVVERYEYTPYGVPSVLDSDFTADDNGESDILTEVLYAGYRYDPESELYQVRHRAFDPQLGRWLQRDPIGVWGDLVNAGNGYGYVGNDPLVSTDPRGLYALVEYPTDPTRQPCEMCGGDFPYNNPKLNLPYCVPFSFKYCDCIEALKDRIAFSRAFASLYARGGEEGVGDNEIADWTTEQYEGATGEEVERVAQVGTDSTTPNIPGNEPIRVGGCKISMPPFPEGDACGQLIWLVLWHHEVAHLDWSKRRGLPCGKYPPGQLYITERYAYTQGAYKAADFIDKLEACCTGPCMPSIPTVGIER